MYLCYLCNWIGATLSTTYEIKEAFRYLLCRERLKLKNMKKKDFLVMLLMAFFTMVGLTSCNDDDEEGRKVTCLLYTSDAADEL